MPLKWMEAVINPSRLNPIELFQHRNGKKTNLPINKKNEKYPRGRKERIPSSPSQ